VVLATVGAGLLLVSRPAAAVSVPGSPRAVSAVPLNGGAKVAWKAPLNDGGSTITRYLVTPYLETTALPPRSFPAAKTSQNIYGLRNGRKYSFTVAALSAAGGGPPSAKSGGVVAGAPGRPGEPRTYIPPHDQIGISFRPPASNGATITGWNATCTSSNGGVAVSGVRQHPAVPIVLLDGLTSGKQYRCTGSATNRWGTGPRSSPTSAFTAS
jgi:hypothetical protein